MSRHFSKDEAQRIFALAAKRQQEDESNSSEGLTLADLEEAGRAAGIDPAYIQSAANDLLRPDRMTTDRRFFGLPVEFRESHVLPLSFDEHNWKKSVDIFSHVYKRTGKTLEVDTTRRWSSEMSENQMPAHIIAEAEAEGTRYTIERKIWPLTLGFGLGGAINLLVALIFTVVGLSVPAASELLLPAVILFATAVLLGISGAVGVNVYSRLEKQRFEQVFMHLKRLAGEAKEIHPLASQTTRDTHSQAIQIPDDAGEQSGETHAEGPSRTKSRS